MGRVYNNYNIIIFEWIPNNNTFPSMCGSLLHGALR